MSTMLTNIGKKFDIDSFLIKTKLPLPINKRYKEELRIASKPDGYIMPHSSLSFELSAVDFNEFEKQKVDTIEFLK